MCKGEVIDWGSLCENKIVHEFIMRWWVSDANNHSSLCTLTGPQQVSESMVATPNT